MDRIIGKLWIRKVAEGIKTPITDTEKNIVFV